MNLNVIKGWVSGESARLSSMDHYWLYVELILPFIFPRNIFLALPAKG